MARQGDGTAVRRATETGLAWNLYVPLARAVSSSGMFRLPLGRATLGERLDGAYGAAVRVAFRMLSPWWESRPLNALRSFLPPAPLRMLALQSWEPETTRLFQRLLRPGMTVVDAGAEIGYYTLLAAMGVGPAGHVYAFEPDPDSLPLLRRNVQMSGYHGSVTVVPLALSDGQGQVELFLGKGKGVTSMYRTRDAGEGATASQEATARVETTSLDAYFAELGWPRVDLIKMDIEGAETLALMGMRELARRNPHLKLIIEFCPQHIRDAGGTPSGFFATLEEVGFTQVRLVSDRLNPVQVSQDLPWLIAMGQRNTVNLLCQRGEE